MLVPEALVRQFYVEGSLRNGGDGWSLEARNPMGDGTIVAVGPLSIDGTDVPVETIHAVVIADAAPEAGEAQPGPEAVVGAATVDRFHPLRFRRGERLRLGIRGGPLESGEHDLNLRLIELNLGALVLRIRDRLAD